MKRKYPGRPIVGVGGIVFDEDRVLLVKRGREPSRGEWSIPGGAMHTGETLKEGVIREVREETHLQVEVLALVKILERIFRDPDGRVAYHYILADFLCVRRSGILTADSDARDACFVSLADLPGYHLPRVTEEVIKQGYRLLKNPELRRAVALQDIYE
jgi:8-oxo-dGTP diphosphatase